MKNIYKAIICAAAAFSLLSCAKEIDGVSEKDLVRKTFTGYADDASTKTSLTSDYNVVWTAKDAVSVFASEDSRKFTVTNLQDEGKVATFEGLVEYAETYYALYPYDEHASMSSEVITTTLPTVQEAVAGTFAQGANLSVAKTSEDNLYFRNAGAIVSFSVEAEGVTSVTLSSLAGDVPMSGAASIDVSSDEPVMTISGAASYVKLEGTFEAGQKYYFVVAPGTYNGLSITFANALTESTCTRTTESTVTIGRNGHKDLGNFVIGEGDWELPEHRSWTLNGKAEVDAFAAAIPDGEKIVVIDLTVTGNDVDDTELRLLASKISEVRGTLTFDGIGDSSIAEWLHSDYFIGNVSCLGGIVLKNISKTLDHRNFNYVSIGGDFIIDNCPNLAKGDWLLGSGGVDAIEEVAGDFIIRGVDINGILFKNLKKVGGNFELSNMNSVWSLSGGMQVEKIGGDLILQDNVNLWSLHGFENLVYIGGNVVIYDNNTKMPLTNSNVDGSDCIGYCLIKDFKDMGVIRPDATIKLGWTGNEINVDDLQSCNPDQPKSYVIFGMDAMQAFLDGKGSEKETVLDLYISGADITGEAFRSIDDRIGTILGTLTIDAVGTSDMWLNTDQCLEYIDIQGSIIIRDVPAHVNPNGLRPVKLTGDVIIQNCPQFPDDWDPFTTLTEVGGSIKVIGPIIGFGSRFFPAIEKIGGDFIMENIEERFWDFRNNTLREIGGDLTITGCPYFENFLGFENLTRLGGNVTVIRPAGHGDWLPEGDYGTDKVGLCIFKGYKENGVMNSDATITAIGRAGIGNDWVYNVDNLAPCGPGFTD